MKYVFLLLFVLATSPHATACSVVIFPPEYEFERSEIVLMARPMAISLRPKEATDLRYTGEFRETVQWEVLLSWKGELKSGDTFTTRRTFDASPCSYEIRLADRNTYLLYGNGSEPYKYFRLIPAQQSSRYMQHLSKRIVQ